MRIFITILYIVVDIRNNLLDIRMGLLNEALCKLMVLGSI